MRVFLCLLTIRVFAVSGLEAQGVSDSLIQEEAAVSQLSGRYNLDPLAAVVPFGPGERLTYNVKIGIINSGSAHMEVLGIDSIREEPSYHLEMSLKGSLLFGAVQVNDHYQSWLGTRSVSSHRYISDVNQLTYSRYRNFEFRPEEMSWEETESGDMGRLATALPLDDISFLYFVRTLPLEIGQTYTLPRYFKKEGNPVVIKVEGKRVVEVPAGTFNTIVVRPIIKTRGLFSEGGEAELYLTDDDNKHLVYLRSKIPIVGSVTLHLESISEGSPIHTGVIGP
ncbi:MAG: hypothetical protein CME22_04760 [Gemmatimonadetes bacterium]|nr:hypothetical protein [Gemmatimonadota bacterium]MCH2451839.1 DUF3108 domain-containing protein [Gemmatimonadota bacterium]